MQALLEVFDKLPDAGADKPTCIISNTVKGKGVSFMENANEWHYAGCDDELTAQALSELEACRPDRG